MFKALEAIKQTEGNLSFLDMFQYQVDSTGQLRLSMISKDPHTSPDAQPVGDIFPSHCLPTEK
jgi:hypothetical protein